MQSKLINTQLENKVISFFIFDPEAYPNFSQKYRFWIYDRTGRVMEESNCFTSKASIAIANILRIKSESVTLETLPQDLISTFGNIANSLSVLREILDYDMVSFLMAEKLIQSLVDLRNRRLMLHHQNKCEQALLDTRNNFEDILEEMQSRLSFVRTLAATQKTIYSYAELLPHVLENMQKGVDDSKEILFKSNIPSMDSLLMGGFRRDFHVLGARPGVGKTTFFMNIINQASIQGVPSYVCSREMGLIALADKLTQIKAGVPIKCDREYSDNEIQRIMAIKGQENGNLFISCEGNETVNKIAEHIIRIKQDTGYKIEVVLIDYIQLLTTEGRTENNAVRLSRISREIKEILVLKLKCCVLVISQVNRSSVATNDKRIEMSSFKGSDGMGEACDYAWGMYRPGYHNKDANDPRVEISLLKSRYGPPGIFNIIWDPETGIFREEPRSIQEWN